MMSVENRFFSSKLSQKWFKVLLGFIISYLKSFQHFDSKISFHFKRVFLLKYDLTNYSITDTLIENIAKSFMMNHLFIYENKIKCIAIHHLLV